MRVVVRPARSEWARLPKYHHPDGTRCRGCRIFRTQLPQHVYRAGLAVHLPGAGRLSVVASEARQLGLTVMMFSGFRLEELLSQALPGVNQLLEYTDILIDGPFVAGRPELKRN